MAEQLACFLTDEEKEGFIAALTPELAVLRKKAKISQGELADFIGTSRQTYGAIERRTRPMSWSMFLTLIVYYDYNPKTHQMIREIGAFPYEIIKRFNGGVELNGSEIGALIVDGMRTIVDSLDDQALHSLKTLMMVEFARCTNTLGEVVVKSFDGKTFNFIPAKTVKASSALKSIKGKKRKK